MIYVRPKLHDAKLNEQKVIADCLIDSEILIRLITDLSFSLKSLANQSRG